MYQLWVTARREEDGKIEEKNERKKKGAKGTEKETQGRGGKEECYGGGENSRGDANLMAAAINNKHRSLIARESSLLFIFLHLPFPFFPSIRYPEIYLASSNRACSVVLHFSSHSSAVVPYSLRPSTPLREHRLPLSPFSEPSNRPRSFLLKGKV